MRRDLHEANRQSWNTATRQHNSHKGDQAAFFRQGGSTLFPEERSLLGDVRGKRLVHLQCNSGQDSLSLVRLGAEVSGVDISDEAITFARQLSQESGLPATFERADVFDWLEQAPSGAWDIAFASYGALCWLSDLPRYAREVARILAPGGTLVIMEFHPFIGMLDEGWVLRYPYSTGGEPQSWDDGVDDYVDFSAGGLWPTALQTAVDSSTGDFRNPDPCHEWVWSLGEILTALLDAGLQITRFEEYPYTNGWRPLPDMLEQPGRRWVPPMPGAWMPLMYGLRAMRPAA